MREKRVKGAEFWKWMGNRKDEGGHREGLGDHLGPLRQSTQYLTAEPCNIRVVCAWVMSVMLMLRESCLGRLSGNAGLEGDKKREFDHITHSSLVALFCAVGYRPGFHGIYRLSE